MHHTTLGRTHRPTISVHKIQCRGTCLTAAHAEIHSLGAELLPQVDCLIHLFLGDVIKETCDTLADGQGYLLTLGGLDALLERECHLERGG